MDKYVNGKNISQLVSKCSKNTFSDNVKATELSTLFKILLSSGVWPSVEDAAKRGIPAGTFVIVDNPETDVQDFEIKIVPKIKQPGDVK